MEVHVTQLVSVAAHVTSCDNHVICFTEKKTVGEGEDFSGHVPEIRNAELKFFCKVSLEGNSAHYALSQTTKVKVETGEKVSLLLLYHKALFYFLLSLSMDY